MLYTAGEIIIWMVLAFLLGFATAWLMQRARHRWIVLPATAASEAAAPVDQPAIPSSTRTLQRRLAKLHEENAAKEARIEELTAELDATSLGTSDRTVARLVAELAERREADRVKDRAIAQLASDLTVANDAAQAHEERVRVAEHRAILLGQEVHDLEIALADLTDEFDAVGTERADRPPVGQPAESVGD